MDVPEVIRVANDFKANLLGREAGEIALMTRCWLEVEQRLAARVDLLALEVVEKGVKPSLGKIYELERTRALLEQARDEVARYQNEFAEPLITQTQREYAELGIHDAAALTRLAYSPGIPPMFAVLPVGAVEAMVGRSADGSPLFSVLKKRALAPHAVGGLIDKLVQATAMGLNPRETARQMQAGLAQGLNKALVIARTEQLNAYRHASQQQYEASGVVLGHRRLAAKDARTCMACLLLDGQLIPVGEVLSDHPTGRCASVPIVEGMPEPEWETGGDWFQRQSEDIQRQMMGPGLFEAWQSGAVRLGDVAAIVHDPVWGDQPIVKSLTEMGLRVVAPPPEEAEGEPTLPWKPVMTREEAEAWSKDSAIQEWVYHGTSAAAMERIVSEGFRTEAIGSHTGNAGMLGRGFYFALEGETASAYGEHLLDVRVNVRSVMREERFLEEARRNNFLGMLAEDPMGGPSRMAEIIRGMGFDAVEFKGELCVFDPENIVVVTNVRQRAQPPVEPAPPWKPTMTREGAEAWSKDSRYRDPVWHVTPVGNVAGLEEKGFDIAPERVKFGRVWGDGVYVGMDETVVDHYAQDLVRKQAAAVGELRVNIKNPFEVEIDPEWVTGPASRRRNVHWDIMDSLGQMDRYVQLRTELADKLEAEDAEFEVQLTHPHAYAFTTVLKEQGYDSLIVRERTLTPRVGGSQIVIFDPRNVTFVSGAWRTIEPVREE